MDAMSLDSRWVLVTGASSGLGREIAKQLALKHKANLVVVARRLERLEKLREELNFYRNIISPVDKKAGLRIQSLAVEPIGNSNHQASALHQSHCGRIAAVAHNTASSTPTAAEVTRYLLILKYRMAVCHQSGK